MMGPLVPDVFSNEFNLVIAFLIGIGFGFILEQAGFSSTRKLVGLFYGYDFTVLRVFFTAGVTALIGVVLLGHFDLLDLGLIYINPTFLWSAILGGCIMGAGFVIGGFCPGTSVCAAAIGKIDAMIFIAGSLIGVLLFAEFYPSLEGIYMAENWGAVRINDLIGISANLFASLSAVVAAIAFIAVTWVENRVNGTQSDYSSRTARRALALGMIPFVVIFLLAVVPSRQEYIQHQIREARQQQKCVFKEMSADKLAYELVNNHYKINLIDVRDSSRYNSYHLPLAINIPVENMQNREWNSYFTQKEKKNVFYADVDTIAKQACLLARFLGKSDNYILHETTDQFRSMFFNAQPPSPDALKDEVILFRMRTQAATDLTDLENAIKRFDEPVKQTAKKVKGGCS